MREEYLHLNHVLSFYNYLGQIGIFLCMGMMLTVDYEKNMIYWYTIMCYIFYVYRCDINHRYEKL